MHDGKLQNRFTITHKDGQPIDPNKRYFVLDISSPDARELTAMTAFVSACRATGYSQLADDLDCFLTDAISQKATRNPGTLPTVDDYQSAALGPLEKVVDELREVDDLAIRHIIQNRDTLEHLTDILNKCWGILYPGKTDWDYPGQVLNHLRVEVERYNNLKAVVGQTARLIEQYRDSLAPEILAALDKIAIDHRLASHGLEADR